MPQWMIVTLIVLMVLVVLGFFALMFAEMGSKRTKGKFSASKGSGTRRKPRPRKSR